MMKKLVFLFAFLFAFMFNLHFFSAQNFPISELGNCASEQECKVYCDDANNLEACLNYAESNELMSQKEITEAKKFLEFFQTGNAPGGCSSKEECDNYCSDEGNLDECTDFGVKEGFIDEHEAEIIKKVGGKGPGGCKGPIECDAYCSKKDNFLQCVEFAHENGIVNDDEYEMAKKTKGDSPGGCNGKEECEAYCKSHEKECMEFAEKYGLDTGGSLGPQNQEEECMMKCLEDEGIDARGCEPSPEGESGGAGCRKCAEQCAELYEGPCMTEDVWREKEQECMAQGEHLEAIPIMGKDSIQPERGECAIDVECVDRSDEWGDNSGEGPGMGEGFSNGESNYEEDFQGMEHPEEMSNEFNNEEEHNLDLSEDESGEESGTEQEASSSESGDEESGSGEEATDLGSSMTGGSVLNEDKLSIENFWKKIKKLLGL